MVRTSAEEIPKCISPALAAIQNNNLSLLQFVCEKGAHKDYNTAGMVFSLLQAAAQTNLLPCLQHLLSQSDIDREARDTRGRTALVVATESGATTAA